MTKKLNDDDENIKIAKSKKQSGLSPNVDSIFSENLKTFFSLLLAAFLSFGLFDASLPILTDKAQFRPPSIFFEKTWGQYRLLFRVCNL